ncbi:MAG: ABC transporter ATP-binding protein [Streptococcaceae bacterium]|jgi:ABC-2 type transport system ATP-binding protein|nr:ABC transporter ATP-binding protein [Streptococcaceae bacterium]
MNGASNAETVLEVQDISKNYDQFSALSNITFQLQAGEILSFIGPNGAGKTTLLKILSGFLTSDSGTILIHEKDLTNQLNHLNALVSTVFGGGTGFYKSASVQENLNFFANLSGLKRAVKSERIRQVLEVVQLSDQKSKRVSKLSMGMLQRLHIARGLLKESPILLLDEPTNGVDAEMSRDIREVVRQIAQKGTAIILTSHILHEVSDLADRIILLNHGEMAFSGDLEAIVEASGVTRIDRPATLEESYLGLMAKLGGAHG